MAKMINKTAQARDLIMKRTGLSQEESAELLYRILCMLEG